METILLVTVLAGTLVLLGFSVVLLRRVSAAAQVDVKAEVAGQIERFNTTLGQKFSAATADMASRLEQTKGDLRQQVTDRIQQGFSEIRSSVEQQLAAGQGRAKPQLERWPQRDDQLSSAHHAATQGRISEPESADRAEPRLDSRSRGLEADGDHRAGAA